MRTKIASIHFKASDSLKEFTEQEVQRLEKLTDDLLGCDVEFTYTKTTKEARLHVNVNGTVLHASESTDDFRKSVALAVEKIEQQIKKLKGKQLAKRGSDE